MQFCDLKKQYGLLKDKIDQRINTVLEHAFYVGGPEVAELEKTLADFTGAKHAVGVSSGTDALVAGLMAHGVGAGDYVVTPPFTFIATAEAVALVGAKPLFVDIETTAFNLDPAKLEEFLKTTDVDKSKIKGVIAVDLYGQPADYSALKKVIADSGLNLFLMGDCAQSFGAEQNGVSVCAITDVACTSFFPAKPLGCFGDGGMIFTNSDEIYEKLIWIRNHGQNVRYSHKIIGLNARIDALQAAILLGKFDAFRDDEIKLRNAVAAKYTELLKPLEKKGLLSLPKVVEGNLSVWAQYTLTTSKRDELGAYLQDNKIPFAIHYPIPLHLQEAFSDLGYKKGDFPVSEKLSECVMSLPFDAYKTDEDIETVCRAVADFFK